MPSFTTHERHVSWKMLLAAGIALTALAGLGGGALEIWWFGRTDAAAAARVEAHVVREFDRMVRAVTEVSARIDGEAAVAALDAGPDGARALFDLVAGARGRGASPGDIAVTIYDLGSVARAWAGTPSEIPAERVSGPATLFVTRSPQGLRLMHVRPLTTGDRRVGAVATEHVLAPAAAGPVNGGAVDTLPTPLAPAALRVEAPGDRGRPGAVLLRAPSGVPLVEAWVDPADLRAARSAWRRLVLAAMLTVLGCTVLLLGGPLLDRRALRDPQGYVRATLGTLGVTAAGGGLLWLAFAAAAGRTPSVPATLLLAGGTAAGMISALAGAVPRLRAAARTRRRPIGGAGPAALAAQLGAGILLAALLVLSQQVLETVVNPASVDVRHFSLHPMQPARLMLLAGMVAIHLATLWAATLVLSSAAARLRVPRAAAARMVIGAMWLAPAAVAAAAAGARGWPLSASGVLLSAAACALAAQAAPRLATWYRRATVAARIFALLLAFLIPTLLLYPSIVFFAEQATRRLIATEYAVQAQSHGQALVARMEAARREVDAIPELAELVRGDTDVPPHADSDAAYLVWKQTALGRERLNSAVELYDVRGRLVSRFALNVPEYSIATTPQGTAGCKWDVFVEVTPFGAEERRMLHAERRICETGASGTPVPRGAVILHVLLEYETYETLPFITSQNPYYEVLRASDEGLHEATPAGNVEVAIYGWGLQPLYTSARTAWPLTDDLFRRIYASREPFWAEATAGGVGYQVYFSNDRERIFAIGYPVLTLFDRFVHLAELTTFAGAAFVLVLIGTAVFTRLSRQRPRVGRALLREIRVSFYRKLLLAFVLAAIIPVLTLALVIRAYFGNLLRSDVAAEAARTAAVARRAIEEVDPSLRRAGALGTESDDFMIWISQVIDQDVNVFSGARLVATSERALFASGVLPTRTPDDVYRAIVLQRLPSFVRQDSIGGFTYMLAAAPVRAAGQNGLLTVPLALRQREIEREIDELDRGVHLAALFFVLVGAGIGLSMAERIADPVRRLTRATGRIARGDFDARIAVRSADELRRLVDAFNSMAAELKAQRAQLERTHRLEAWAEMARQVAHEIKNPLTPIQLSAEHLQRVHADRGQPMGPVLESCVSSILGQVRLLRQISSEFSSFASSPTARPAPVDLPELVAEVIDPYRTGLDGRVQIENRVPAALPPVLVDRTLVARALSNIVENALHAMPGPGVLRLEADVEAGAVRLDVSDTGVGMDEEALGRVFEPYFSTKTTGTGLGLPIARRNIELNGGAIEVESTKGAGTTVRVRLPRASSR